MNEKNMYRDSVQQMLMALHPFSHMLNGPASEEARLASIEESLSVVADALSHIVASSPDIDTDHTALKTFRDWQKARSAKGAETSEEQMQKHKKALEDIIAIRQTEPEKFFILLSYFMERLQSGLETTPHGMDE